MADNVQFIRDLFSKASVPISQDDVWEVQKTPVVKHKALERLGAAIGIEYAPPQILRSQSDEAVILCTGKKGDKTEWSIGEAKIVPMISTGQKNKWGKPIYEPQDGAIGNYQITPKQASYPYAMAEKRAKDRVILKLAGLHGVYSEEEADEFKHQENVETSPPKTTSEEAAPKEPAITPDMQQRYADEFTQWLAQADDVAVVRSIWRKEQPSRSDLKIEGTDLEKALNAAWKLRGSELAKAAGSPNAP
jgi:hypothetical protein